MANELLQLIAQPQMANVVGQFQAGQQASTQNKLSQLALQQGQQQVEMGNLQLQQQRQAANSTEQKLLEAQKLQEIAFDLTTATAISDPEKQEQLLRNIQQKALSTPLGNSQYLNEVLSAPAGPARDKLLIEGIVDAQLLGLLPGGDVAAARVKAREKAEIEATAPTSLQKDLIAAGLKPGSPEFQQAILGAKLKPATQIEIRQGKIPEGYQMAPDGKSMMPIPGSPADDARRQSLVRTQQAAAATRQQAALVQDKLSEAIAGTGFFTTGIPGAITGLVPQTPAYDLNETLDTIKANLAFDKLQEMRAMSPTGGALGQVSERELAQLERAVASLNSKQSKDQLVKNLKRVQLHYNNWLENARKSYNAQAELFGGSIGGGTGSSQGGGQVLNFDAQGNLIQ